MKRTRFTLAGLNLAAGAALSLSGCMAPQFQIPQGTAAVAYANLKEMYGAARVLLTQACRSGRLDADACKELRDEQIRLRVIDAMVQKILSDPQTPPDWGKILDYAQIAIGIATKAAGVP